MRDSEEIERDIRLHLHELLMFISDGEGTWESLDELEKKLSEAVAIGPGRKGDAA